MPTRVAPSGLARSYRSLAGATAHRSELWACEPQVLTRDAVLHIVEEPCDLVEEVKRRQATTHGRSFARWSAGSGCWVLLSVARRCSR
jgi:hypothetical protein